MRGEFPLLWSFTDSPNPDGEVVKDDTIEPPAEAAQRARAEARAKAEGIDNESPAESEVNGTVEGGETIIDQETDDSWMNDPVGLPGSDGKARKRKGNKKK